MQIPVMALFTNIITADKTKVDVLCFAYRRQFTIRHNVSFDDLGGTVSPSENPDALLAHNTFYVRKGVPFIRNKMDGGAYTEEDNTIIPL